MLRIVLPQYARGLGLAVGVVASLSVAAVACVAIRRRLSEEQRRKEEQKETQEKDEDVDTILAGTMQGWAQGEQEPEQGEERAQGLILDATLARLLRRTQTRSISCQQGFWTTRSPRTRFGSHPGNIMPA